MQCIAEDFRSLTPRLVTPLSFGESITERVEPPATAVPTECHCGSSALVFLGEDGVRFGRGLAFSARACSIAMDHVGSLDLPGDSCRCCARPRISLSRGEQGETSALEGAVGRGLGVNRCCPRAF